jgi:hypothetical protein
MDRCHGAASRLTPPLATTTAKAMWCIPNDSFGVASARAQASHTWVDPGLGSAHGSIVL